LIDKETIYLNEDMNGVIRDKCCKMDDVVFLLDVNPNLGGSNTLQFYKKEVLFFTPNLGIYFTNGRQPLGTKI
jgi:hypothetical protein